MIYKHVYITPIGQIIPVIDNSYMAVADRRCKSAKRIDEDAFTAWDKGIPDEYLAVEGGKVVVMQYRKAFL